jgi:hypothetical protein
MHSTDDVIPHIDIYQFDARQDHDWWTLVTGGMSDNTQFVPDGYPEYVSKRLEILMYVEEPKPWMFDVLKGLAEMPLEEKTFLHWWHTVPNGKPMTAEPSLLTNFFFLPPYFEEPKFDSLHLDGEKVDFLWMIPITEAEREYAIQNGGQALEELFEESEMHPVVINTYKASPCQEVTPPH